MNGRAVFSATLGRPFFFGDLDMIGVGAGTALGADDGFACLDVGRHRRPQRATAQADKMGLSASLGWICTQWGPARTSLMSLIDTFLDRGVSRSL